MGLDWLILTSKATYRPKFGPDLGQIWPKLIFQAIKAKFTPGVAFWPTWMIFESNLQFFTFRGHFRPNIGPNLVHIGSKMGQKLVYWATNAKFAPGVACCPFWMKFHSNFHFWTIRLFNWLNIGPWFGPNWAENSFFSYLYWIQTRFGLMEVVSIFGFIID